MRPFQKNDYDDDDFYEGYFTTIRDSDVHLIKISAKPELTNSRRNLSFVKTTLHFTRKPYFLQSLFKTKDELIEQVYKFSKVSNIKTTCVGKRRVHVRDFDKRIAEPLPGKLAFHNGSNVGFNTTAREFSDLVLKIIDNRRVIHFERRLYKHSLIFDISVRGEKSVFYNCIFSPYVESAVTALVKYESEWRDLGFNQPIKAFSSLACYKFFDSCRSGVNPASVLFFIRYYDGIIIPVIKRRSRMPTGLSYHMVICVSDDHFPIKENVMIFHRSFCDVKIMMHTAVEISLEKRYCSFGCDAPGVAEIVPTTQNIISYVYKIDSFDETIYSLDFRSSHFDKFSINTSLWNLQGFECSQWATYCSFKVVFGDNVCLMTNSNIEIYYYVDISLDIRDSNLGLYSYWSDSDIVCYFRYMMVSDVEAARYDFKSLFKGWLKSRCCEFKGSHQGLIWVPDVGLPLILTKFKFRRLLYYVLKHRHKHMIDFLPRDRDGYIITYGDKTSVTSVDLARFVF